jgi:hypothetical protein
VTTTAPGGKPETFANPYGRKAREMHQAPLLVGRERGPAVMGAGYESGGYALVISCWNWAENQAPEMGALGSAPVMLLPLRALPV